MKFVKWIQPWHVMRSRGLQFQEYGKPEEVLKLVEKEIREPESQEVVVEMLAAPINPSDLGTIGGSYGLLPELPAIGGLEGVGRIVKTGPEVTGFEEGDHVRLPPDLGTWSTHRTCQVDKLEVIPRELPVAQAAMSAVNPLTAELLLEKLGAEGDWFVQNAANSAVGIAMIQISKARGIPCVNLVRREALIQPLKALGAEYVFLDDEESVQKIREVSKSFGNPSHAFNSVGGESAYRLAKSLRDGGHHITFGAMTGEKVRFPTRYLIFNDVLFSGFWVTRWKSQTPSEVYEEYQNRVYQHIRNGTLKLPVESTYTLSEFQEALAHNARPRFGKILFVT